MSKIGIKPISVPSAVQVTIQEQAVEVKGPMGVMTVPYSPEVQIKMEDGTLTVSETEETKESKAKQGLYRMLIANAVQGVEKKWEKRLEIVGTGYNAKQQGEDVVFKVGYSHPVVFKKEEGVSYKVEGNNKVVISGIDKQLVGEIAYKMRIIRKPDVYKGKGLRYEGEKVRIKPGKKAKA